MEGVQKNPLSHQVSGEESQVGSASGQVKSGAQALGLKAAATGEDTTPVCGPGLSPTHPELCRSHPESTPSPASSVSGRNPRHHLADSSLSEDGQGDDHKDRPAGGEGPLNVQPTRAQGHHMLSQADAGSDKDAGPHEFCLGLSEMVNGGADRTTLVKYILEYRCPEKDRHIDKKQVLEFVCIVLRSLVKNECSSEELSGAVVYMQTLLQIYGQDEENASKGVITHDQGTMASDGNDEEETVYDTEANQHGGARPKHKGQRDRKPPELGSQGKEEQEAIGVQFEEVVKTEKSAQDSLNKATTDQLNGTQKEKPASKEEKTQDSVEGTPKEKESQRQDNNQSPVKTSSLKESTKEEANSLTEETMRKLYDTTDQGPVNQQDGATIPSTASDPDAEIEKSHSKQSQLHKTMESLKRQKEIQSKEFKPNSLVRNLSRDCLEELESLDDDRGGIKCWKDIAELQKIDPERVRNIDVSTSKACLSPFRRLLDHQLPNYTIRDLHANLVFLKRSDILQRLKGHGLHCLDDLETANLQSN